MKEFVNSQLLSVVRESLDYLEKQLESKDNEIACLHAALRENRDAVVVLNQIYQDLGDGGVVKTYTYNCLLKALQIKG